MSSKKTTIDIFFSSRLKTLINNILNIKRGDFCNKTGISKGYLGMILTNKRGPSAELIIGLFIHYRYYLDWLLTGDGDPYNIVDQSAPSTLSNSSKTPAADPLQEVLNMARHVLASGTDHAGSLASNIKLAFNAIQDNQDKKLLEEKCDKALNELEQIKQQISLGREKEENSTAAQAVGS
jgi:hypothetical protein